MEVGVCIGNLRKNRDIYFRGPSGSRCISSLEGSSTKLLKVDHDKTLPVGGSATVYPGKTSIPAGSLYSLRIWVRANGVEHRVFAEDELWVGKDLDFYSISQAAIMILRSVDNRSQVYHGYVGRALVTFTCSSVPITSVPAGSSHRIRIWTKSLVNAPATEPTTLPFQDSYIFQRVYKNDMLKIGAHLDFENMSTKATMGFAAGPVQTIVTTIPAPISPTSTSRSMYPDEKAQKGYS
ncbi:hypothetical protein C0992_009193 [Termitomyces sp. T32_za158]|nr:hypothetical protein C0992_009193 [Termitomyces sp. T32_za158]